MLMDIIESPTGEVLAITPSIQSRVDLTIPKKYEYGWAIAIGSLIGLYFWSGVRRKK